MTRFRGQAVNYLIYLVRRIVWRNNPRTKCSANVNTISAAFPGNVELSNVLLCHGLSLISYEHLTKNAVKSSEADKEIEVCVRC